MKCQILPVYRFSAYGYSLISFGVYYFFHCLDRIQAYALHDLAEHGSGLEQAVLVSDSFETLELVRQEVERQAESLPRLATVKKVMNYGMFLIECADMKEACRIANQFAPEHLEVMTASPEALLDDLNAAGAIFLGQWTPEPAGDFTAGPSHVLPTAGTAKFFHGITAGDFMRRSSILQYSEDALMKEVSSIEKFASMEGLAAHGRSASIRRDKTV